MIIVYRKRVNPLGIFTEFLVNPIQKNSKSVLSLLLKLPVRYEQRIVNSTVKNISNVETYCFEVKSLSFDLPEKTKKQDLIKSEGIWLVRDDFLLKGEFEPNGQQGISQFMGITIECESCKVILESGLGSLSPYSLYHGTWKENKDAILLKGFLSNYGMLGTAVYFSTFWKACRFACLGQDYKIREGLIFRCLIFAENIKTLPSKDFLCSCCSSPGNIIADHESTWKKSYDAVKAMASRESVGKCRDGTPKYLLRNEEWAIEPNRILITHFSEVNQNTLSGPHYDPMHRGTEIL